ncbi:translocation/assembly module TamB domain-containing protein [Sulfuriferula sp.]|uniref:translocation/assembly module TamB domain-containing protein n=1 Tax=Sulfuriferula sp. TaxID=2025307 RepID=UPI00272FFB60|nr:translocation/assembly module TamB domain-containing protein [Sulfuriferula sp.]
MQWGRFSLRWLRGLVISVLLLLAGAAIVLWGLGQAPGLRTLVQLAERFSHGELRLEGVSGSFYGSLQIKTLRYETAEKQFVARDVVFDWAPRELLHTQRLHITQLQMQSLDVTLIKPSTTPLTLPKTLRLPFELMLPDARIERLTVHDQGKDYVFNQFRLSLDNPGSAYHARLSLLTPWGAGHASGSLGANAPYVLQAQLQLAQNDGLHSYKVDSALSGSLAHFEIIGSGTSGAAIGRWQVSVTPFDAIPLQQASLKIQRLDPQRLGAGLPQADLDANLQLQASAKDHFSGTVQVLNRLPGALDAQRLPLRQLQAQVDGSLTRWTLRGVQLDLGEAGKFSGEGSLQAGVLQASLVTAGFNLHGLLGQLRPTRLAGKITLGADTTAQTLTADLAQADYRIQLNARRQGDSISLTSARLAAAGGALTVSGQLGLSGQRSFKASGMLARFDPSHFGAYPAATLNATFSAQGQLNPQLWAALRVNIADSRYRGQPLSGNAVFNLAQQRVWDSVLKLRLGVNQLDAAGAFGKPGDSLNWRVNAPKLSALAKDLAGQLSGQGTLTGSFAQPAGSFNLKATALDWQGKQHVDALNATGQLAQGQAGRLALSAQLTGLRSGTLVLESAALAAQGTRSAHTLAVSARSPQLDLHTTLAGGWHANQGWRGQILRLENTGSYPLKLNAPAGLAVGPAQFNLAGADLAVARGRVQIQSLGWVNGHITSQGSMQALDTGYLLALTKLRPGVNSSLIIGGKWQFDAADQVNGSVELWREQGDINVPTSPPTALGINFLKLSIKAVASRIQADLNLTGTTLGSLSARADTVLVRHNAAWGLSGNAPLAVGAQATMPSLAWLSGLVGGAVGLDGAVQAGVGITGSVNAPVLSGLITAQNLQLDYPQQGVQLKDGNLRASLSNDTITLESLVMHAGKGSLSATGTVVLHDAKPSLNIKLVADQLALLQRPDRQLVVSGQGEIMGAQQLIRGSAKLTVDRGTITLPKDNAPTLSSDVVVLGRQGSPSTKAQTYALDFDLDLDLGSQFYLKGRGVDAQLGGSLQIRSRAGRLPTATGTIAVTKGTYNAYGQKLSITRGILNFNGLLDNPGLNILAERKTPTTIGSAGLGASDSVEAGVAITGTARAPQVKLVSTPNVPDSEKLSWLVLGHGTANASANEFSALQTAAGVLLGMGDSVSLQAKIADATGLSEISLAGGGSLESSIIVLGKRLSKDLYLTYEQGLAGTTSLVKITYEMSRRVSLRLQTGSQSAVDIFYTFRFR